LTLVLAAAAARSWVVPTVTGSPIGGMTGTDVELRI